MGVRELRKEIRTAMKAAGACENAMITTREEKKLERLTTKDKVVSPAEGREWEKLLGKAEVTNPGGMMTAACPEHGKDYVGIDERAVKSANAMFVQFNVPYGDNKEKIRDNILRTLEAIDLGAALPKAPSTRMLHEVHLRDMRMVDGPREDAYFDAKKNEFYLKVTGSGMGGPDTIGPYWFGPIAVSEDSNKQVSDATINKMRRKLARGLANDSLEFVYGQLPVGARFVRVPLMQERHPDGYSYEGAISVGALVPGAETSDPNKAKSFWIVRTGGLGGLTAVAGPEKL